MGIDSRKSFYSGYVAVKSGHITKELTMGEIEERYPQHNLAAFAEGMEDALIGDNFRYIEIKRALADDGFIQVY